MLVVVGTVRRLLLLMILIIAINVMMASIIRIAMFMSVTITVFYDCCWYIELVWQIPTKPQSRAPRIQDSSG